MLNNYFGQLQQSYPEKAEMLEWMKYSLDSKMYYYGSHFNTPDISRLSRLNIKKRIASLYNHIKIKNVSYEGYVISNAYFDVANNIRNAGFKVALPPWQLGILSKTSKEALYQMTYSNFNSVISDSFFNRVYYLRDELREFFKKNHTPFLLLANDLAPIHRIAIDVCKDLKIPTGVFLHGLPARYNNVDDSRGDYLFVWGERIKDNYKNAGSNTNIVVTGHPNISSFKIDKIKPENIVVLSRAVCGAPSTSNRHVIDERGICIQHAFAIESALKKVGIEKAVLRLHPSENKDWYRKFVDNNFFEIDTRSLKYTIGHAQMVIGYISTVMLDTVLNDIPCYPFVINKDLNPYADFIVPPFNNKPAFPTSNTIEELANNIMAGHCVKKEHFDGYINPTFDVAQITQFIK